MQARYKEYEKVSIHECDECEIEPAIRRGMPIIEVESTVENTEAFPMIRKEVHQDASKRLEDIHFYINHGYMKTWAGVHCNEPDRGLKEYSTETRWKQYKAGVITREKAVEFACKRFEKALEKDTAKKLEKLDRVAAATDLGYIDITVEWVRSYTWGNNPHAVVKTNNGTFEGRASGCGYDKESAAIANAFNQSDSILKELYTLKEKALSAGVKDESKTACTGRNNTPVCGYGAGYCAIPAFEGGVGSSCFWEILKKCGFNTGIHNTRRASFYEVVKAGD